MTVACVDCTDPGKCCRDFPLIGVTQQDYPTKLHVLAYMATVWYEVGESRVSTAIGFPFIPIYTEQHPGLSYRTWRFMCLNLEADGSCGDYENRPYGPCVVYEPGWDKLCAMHTPREIVA
jgi:hypothetical protein